MAKQAINIDAVPRVTVFAGARALGITPDHFAALCGTENLVEDWRGAPSVTAAFAREVVDRFKQDEREKFLAEQHATAQREAREAFVTQYVREGLDQAHAEAIAQGSLRSSDTYKTGDETVLVPAAFVQTDVAALVAELREKGEREATRRGL